MCLVKYSASLLLLDQSAPIRLNIGFIISGSMADQTCIQVSLQIVKFLAYICTFLFVLGGAVLSKGTLLFMTSQLNRTTIDFCNATFNGNYEHLLPLSYFLGPHGLSKIQCVSSPT